MTGNTIGQYKILEKLGEGGMGVVYKASDTRLNRTVALKFLPERVNRDEGAKARFLQEAQAAAGLNHPNICTIYGVDEQEGQLFMSMEYIEGGTLREKLPFAKPDDALAVAIQIGEALQEAHAREIVHRDIKADNVMLNSKGQAKVMDFGLAKLRGAMKLTRTSSTVGTLGYMSPEQIQGGEADHRSDIFSFGVLLFELLTGKLPFRGDHEAAMVYSIVNEEPESVDKYLPGASPEVSRILEKALEKDPADRYQTAADFVVDLRRARKQSTRVSRELTQSALAAAAGQAPTPSGQVPVAGPSVFARFRWIILTALVLIAAGVVALVFLRNPTPEVNPNMTVRELEVPLTNIRYHGLSGDGNWAAFPGRDAGGNWHVYFMNTGGGEPKVITSDSMRWIQSVDVSMDGSRVAYGGTTPSGNTPAIIVASALGGGTRVVAQDGIVPRWRPDGERIFYYKWMWSAGRMTDHAIWSVTPEGTDNRLEFTDSVSIQGRISLSVSPDGGAVAWLRTFPDGGYQEIMTRELATGAETQVTFDRKNIDEVCWASNGQIIFSSNRGGNTNLWTVPAEGGEVVQITKGLGPDLGIHISRDLTKLLYNQQRNMSDLWIGSLATGSSWQVTFDDRLKYDPNLSPDGQHILFTSANPDPLRNESSIFICNRDGSDRRKLISDSGMWTYFPKFSPNGKRLVYSAQDPRFPEDSSLVLKTYVADVSVAGTPRELGNAWLTNWINDDTLVLYRDGKTFLTPVDGGTPVPIFEDSLYAVPIPGGKYVAYIDQHTSAKRDWWVVSVDASFNRTGTARKIGGGGDVVSGPILSPSADFVLFMKKGGKLLKVSLPDLKEETIPGTFPNIASFWDVSVNPGTQEFIFYVNRTQDKLVMIEHPFK